ncbi:MAG: sugar ABC transporter permease [Clostridiales bacterium]|nr:sugar ABC transporter permease [Clostridiales bacterium]
MKVASIKRRQLAYSSDSSSGNPEKTKEELAARLSWKEKRKLKAERLAEPKVELNRRTLRRQKELLLITIPFVLYGFIFYYLPLGGWIMAFQDYEPKDGLLGSEFVGLDVFRYIFGEESFLYAFRNTLAMGVINLVLSFVFAIGFALLLNEVRLRGPKKFAQTVSYLPHFLSWIIVVGIVRDMLSMDHGIVNDLLVRFDILDKPMNFFSKPDLFWWIVGFSNVWKETGWNSIIYLAAITAINPEMYEAAALDGAGRFGKMWHVTLPGIKPTIFILLMINIGNVLNVGFEIQYLLTNAMIKKVSETIDIWVLYWGIGQGDFSVGTAAGIFKSVVSIILIYLANSAAKATGEERLF